MSTKNYICVACEKDLIQEGLDLCLTQCGHMFHKQCIFVEGMKNKIKYLACPTCFSQAFRPVIPIFPRITSADPAPALGPNHYQSLARAAPTTAEDGEEIDSKDLAAHSIRVEEFNKTLKETLELEQSNRDKAAANRRLEMEIKELRRELGEEDDETPSNVKNEVAPPSIAPEFANICVDNVDPNDMDAESSPSDDDDDDEGGVIETDVGAEEEEEEEDDDEIEDDVIVDPDFEIGEYEGSDDDDIDDEDDDDDTDMEE